MVTMQESFADYSRDLARTVLEGPGVLSPDVRRALADGGDGPDGAAAYVAKLRQQAAEIGDADVAALKAAGLSEDAIFELTVAVAFGEGMRRLAAGMAALEGATDAIGMP